MNFADLRRECERDGIGPLFWELLVAVCQRIARPYPPDVYNHGESWSEEAVVDLAQDVTLERLLGENQLAYVLRLATDEDSLGRLLAFQVRRVLAHRRTVTVVDRLVGRVKSLIRQPPFEQAPLGSDMFFTTSEAGGEPRFLPDDALRHGAQLILDIPRLPSSPAAQRESRVYQPDDLREVLERLVDSFGGIAVGDVRKILGIVLTAWLPTLLRDTEEESASVSSPELELQRSHMRALVEELARDLEPVHRTVLLGKSQGISDGALATRVGRSRPWLADRKNEVLALIESRLIEELPEELHTEATSLLLEEVVALEEIE